ncbi:MAG: type II toxin-antitoxin system RelE/ParE family toxin [Betaproteobacteria bacterium]|nr:type II toxin-antitoxin system RelE/ParE family toxin [Betaproteobacteria bacterium]
MAWRVEFLPAADKAFGKLDRQHQRRIQKFIETRLQTANDPHDLGEGYTGPLKGYWKYRIGDYRLVCDIQDRTQTILVVAIGDRKDVYR